MRWLSVAFLVNRVFMVPRAGREFTTPALHVRTFNHYTKTPLVSTHSWVNGPQSYFGHHPVFYTTFNVGLEDYLSTLFGILRKVFQYDSIRLRDEKQRLPGPDLTNGKSPQSLF